MGIEVGWQVALAMRFELSRFRHYGAKPWRARRAIARSRRRCISTGRISRRPEIPTEHRCRNGRGSNRINADTWSSFPRGQSKRSISGAHSACCSRHRPRPTAGRRFSAGSTQLRPESPCCIGAAILGLEPDFWGFWISNCNWDTQRWKHRAFSLLLEFLHFSTENAGG